AALDWGRFNHTQVQRRTASTTFFASLHLCAFALSSPKPKTTCPVVSAHYCDGVNVLFIADIVGEPGRRAVKELLPKLRARYELDLVVANGENAAGGSGITPKTAADIFSAGVDI